MGEYVHVGPLLPGEATAIEVRGAGVYGGFVVPWGIVDGQVLHPRHLRDGELERSVFGSGGGELLTRRGTSGSSPSTSAYATRQRPATTSIRVNSRRVRRLR